MNPEDWKKAWQMIEEKWDRDDPCTDGALQPFNIDAKLNGAYIAIGLLYGRGDFARTLEITTRCGQDSDCNPSSAAGILGVILGYSRIPDEWKSGIPKIAGEKFQFTSYSYEDIVRSTLARAGKAIEGAGGRVTGDEAVIPLQAPVAPALEGWTMGIPEAILGTDDPAWTWKGPWSPEKGGKAAVGQGAEAILRFTGTAVAIVGPLGQDGGKAAVFLDGKEAGEMNAYIEERTFDNDLFHAYDLKPGIHELRIVMKGDADPRSKGKKIIVQKAIAYRSG